MFAYNTQIHSSTHYTPYELLFGHKPILPSNITQAPKFEYTYDDYHKNLQLKLNNSFQIAKNNLENAKMTSKNFYDKKTNDHNFKVGDLAYLLTKQIKPGQSKKLTAKYSGPYEVVKVNKNNTVQLKIKNKSLTYHKDLLKPHIVSDVDLALGASSDSA
ncbi:Retrovirus-related Pol polyprotein from transposon 412-like Protein [Tribolium castaneum]|uniref:Retrovirus-related Pol polyprotein from transposon 412-like Protein n=1 Tax=Tribolium castaneum TaxID=7070 RepID=D2A616_TRICA|nr:Retrovirus-related Pol polyprotein from transposon 412-like Protein [Tribolium castaneum]